MRATSPRSTGSCSTCIRPASSRERSSRSVASFASRSTCSRIVSRNSWRVASSTSSSAISSRKPPSENSGVRSSCEALAMNSLRARSSLPSRPRMRSNASARSPSSSLPVSTTGSSKRPPAIRSAARSSRRMRCACTDASAVAGAPRRRAGAIRPANSSRRSIRLQARERIGERVAEQDHDALGLERHGHLGEPAAAALDGAALERTRCRDRSSAIGSRATSRDDAVFESPKTNGWSCEDRVDDDARLEDRGRALGELPARCRRCVSVVARHASCASSSSWSSFALTSSVLERGDDDQVDDAERAGDDDEQRQRQPEPDAADPRPAHVSAPGSDSRRRAR